MTTAGKSISMYDTKGRRHDLKSSTVLMILGVGWVAFALCLLFNILYYALHPSQVSRSSVVLQQKQNISIFSLQVDILNIRKKLVVAVVGYEINLVKFTMKGLDTKLIF